MQFARMLDLPIYGIVADSLSGLVDTQMVKDINETSELHAENIPQLFKRMAEPREIAALIAYLLGDESKFTTGVAYPIDGGFCS